MLDPLMLDPLSRKAYARALYHHMRKIASALASIDAEIQVTRGGKDDTAALILKCLHTMRVLLASGVFDTKFYLTANPDIRGSDVDAVRHYVMYGEEEGRTPNAVFCPLYYRRDAMPGAPPEQNALQHYIEEGERAGRNASPAFAPRAYLEANPLLAMFVDRPLFHFLKIGQAAELGLQPASNPVFDSSASSFDRGQWHRLATEIERLDRRCPRNFSGRSLVMGLATNYSKKDIAPFVRSLRGVGYDGDIVLWVSDLDSETKEFLAEHSAHCQFFWEMSFLPLDCMLSRNYSYYSLMRSMEDRNRYCDRVFLTDVRDVVFQDDPFSGAPTGEVIVFLEDPRWTLDTCPYHAYWLRTLFGDQVLNEVSGRRISCAGTVLGTWNGILRYLLLMQLTTFQCAVPARLLEGIDQGIHNVILHRNKLPAVTVVENAEHVFTMGTVPRENVLITRDKKVADLRGRICPVLHQYDRHPAVVELVNELYGAS
jgi:hypothetical protein